MFAALTDDLIVEVAGRYEQDRFSRADGAHWFAIAPQEPDFEEGPDISTDRFSEPGVESEDEAIMQG